MSGFAEAPARIARELALRSLLVARLPDDAEDPRLGARLADAFDELTLHDGETLYRPGDTPEHAFVVAEGRVALETGRRRLSFGPGEPLGLLDAVRRRPRVGHALAEGEARVLRMRVEDWLELLEDNFTYARGTVVDAARAVHGLSLGAGVPPPPPPPPPPSPSAPATASSSAPPGALDDVERALALRAVPALSRASVQALIDLARLASDLAVEPGPLPPAAWRPSHLYVVARGAVRARRRGEPAVAADFGPGTFVGGPGALAGVEGEYEAVALEPSLLVAFEREDYFDLMEDHFDMVRSALTALIDERERLLSVEVSAS